MKISEVLKVVNEGRADKSRKELDTDFDESIKKYLNKIIDEDRKIGIEVLPKLTKML